MNDRSRRNVHPPMETARLRLRIIRPGDEPFLAELYADPVVMEYVYDGAVSWEKARLDAQVDVELAAHRRFAGTWLVEKRDSLVPLGWVQFSKLAGGDRDDLQVGISLRQRTGATRRIPDLKTLRQEARAWNRRMNRDRVKINWKFDRKAARRKFGYQRKPFTRSRT